MPANLKKVVKECRKALRKEIPEELRENLTKEALHEELAARAKLMTKGALKYFKKTIYGKSESKLAGDMKLYRLCRYFDPISFRGIMHDNNYNSFKQLFDEIWDMRGTDDTRRSSVFEQQDLQAI